MVAGMWVPTEPKVAVKGNAPMGKKWRSTSKEAVDTGIPPKRPPASLHGRMCRSSRRHPADSGPQRRGRTRRAGARGAEGEVQQRSGWQRRKGGNREQQSGNAGEPHAARARGWEKSSRARTHISHKFVYVFDRLGGPGSQFMGAVWRRGGIDGQPFLLFLW